MRYVVLLIIAICLNFMSCNSDDEKFENIELETTGIELSKLSGNTYYGEIGVAGGEVTFVATGKNKDNGFLSQIRVGDYVYEVTDSDRGQQLPYMICEEEWGKIEILSLSPHTIRIVFHANESGSNMKYELEFGMGYKYSRVLITQLKGFA